MPYGAAAVNCECGSATVTVTGGAKALYIKNLSNITEYVDINDSATGLDVKIAAGTAFPIAAGDAHTFGPLSYDWINNFQHGTGSGTAATLNWGEM